ncbi:MAG: NlpC/P60 family protein [Clostridia bacterium]
MKVNIQKIISLFLVLIMLFSSAPVFSSAPEDFFLGDANLDGAINTGDVAEILMYCADLIIMQPYGYSLSDLNGDKIVNTGDAQLLLLYNVGAINGFPDGAPIIIADFENPIDYFNLDYLRPIEDNAFDVVYLGEYSSYAVYEPSGNLTYGVGYKIHISSLTNLVIETFRIEERVDTKIYIFDDEFNIVDFDDDSGTYGGFSRVVINKEKGIDGDYSLLVCGYDSNSTGSFALAISSNSGNPDGEPTDPPESPTPTQTPRPTPTLTPRPTPTLTPRPTPTLTPRPTPTQTPRPTTTATPIPGGVVFNNVSVPEDGDAVMYNRAYALVGTVHSDFPIESVSVTITDIAKNTVEISAVSGGISYEGAPVYDFSLNGGSNSIDSKIAFASLTVGEKTFELFVKLKGRDEVLIYSSDFYVKVMQGNILGQVYNGSTLITSAETLNALADYLSSLDMTETGNQVLLEGLRYIGTTYGTSEGQLDCSKFTQTAYANGADISLPRIAAEQARYCYTHDFIIENEEDLIPGDLVFHRQKSSNCDCGRFMEIHHVAMYLGNVNSVRYFIESSSSRRKVCIRVFWGSTNYDSSSDWYIPIMGRPRSN